MVVSVGVLLGVQPFGFNVELRNLVSFDRPADDPSNAHICAVSVCAPPLWQPPPRGKGMRIQCLSVVVMNRGTMFLGDLNVQLQSFSIAVNIGRVGQRCGTGKEISVLFKNRIE